MNKLIKFGLALAAATGFAGTVAKADTVTIDWSATQTGAQTQLATGTGFAAFAGAINANFTTNSISGTASPNLALPALLGSNSINVTGAAGGVPGTIFIWVTDSNITAPVSQIVPFLSTLTSNTLTGAGTTLTLETFYSAANNVGNTGLGTDTVIGGPETFTTGPLTGVFGTDVLVGPGPYSVIAMYEVTTAVAGGSANATINIAVPGPIVGAGLPGLLAACGGLIALARRRRQQRA